MSVESANSTSRVPAALRPERVAGTLCGLLSAGVVSVGVAGSHLEAAFEAVHHPAAVRRGLFVLLLTLLIAARVARSARAACPAARAAGLRSLSRNLLLLMYGMIAGQQAVELLRRSWHDGAFDAARALAYLQMPLADANAQLGTFSREYVACGIVALLVVRALSALPPPVIWETSH